MAKSKIAIGITTYKDITSPEYAERLYQACLTASKKIVPNRLNFLGVKCSVSSCGQFAQNWTKKYARETRENRSKNAKVLDKGELHVGAEWSTVGAISGKGSLGLPPTKEPLKSYTIQLQYNFNENIDWLNLFRNIIGFTSPSYGMMHLFSPEDIQLKRSGGTTFGGPVIGESQFVRWATSISTIRKPDSWEFEKRRNYIALPELSWANYLGSEFSGNYNASCLEEASHLFEIDNDGVLILATKNVSDVLVQEKNTKKFAKFKNHAFRRFAFMRHKPSKRLQRDTISPTPSASLQRLRFATALRAAPEAKRYCSEY